jgi:acyl dehydratase
VSISPSPAPGKSGVAMVSVPKQFAEIEPGDYAVLEKRISAEEIERFASLSGDFNPLHVDADFARQTQFARPVAHGMLLGCYVSTLIGMRLPGPGALWTQQTFRWLRPVFAGDVIRLVLRVVHKSPGSRTLKVDFEASNQDDIRIMEGTGLVMLLEKKTPATTAV